MTKASRKAAQAIEDAELRAAIAEMDARHALVEMQDRHERERWMDQLKQEDARARLEAQAQALEEQQAEAETLTPPAAAPPLRDERGRYAIEQPVVTDRGLPTGITDSELQAAQNGSLSMESYLMMRDRLHLGQRDAGLFG
jgi:hypothetical protein